MTIIAWDGTTLAADRLCSNGGTRESITKIWKVGGHLLAGSGNAYLSSAMTEWFRGGRVPAAYPKDVWEATDGGNFWVIEPTGRLVEYATKVPVGVSVDPQPMAIGCGRRCALAAMHLGFDARRAVEVAIAIEIGCGMGVDTLTL